MSIKVVLADDSEIMRQALQRLLKSEPAIAVVGEASSFSTAVQLVADYKPDVLLIDLHLPHKRDFAPAVVKAQLHCVECTIAISFAVDNEAAGLAESYGAVTLLDKMKLYNDLIPAILKHQRAIPAPPPQKRNPAEPSQPNQIS